MMDRFFSHFLSEERGSHNSTCQEVKKIHFFITAFHDFKIGTAEDASFLKYILLSMYRKNLPRTAFRTVIDLFSVGK